MEHKNSPKSADSPSQGANPHGHDHSDDRVQFAAKLREEITAGTRERLVQPPRKEKKEETSVAVNKILDGFSLEG